MCSIIWKKDWVRLSSMGLGAQNTKWKRKGYWLVLCAFRTTRPNQVRFQRETWKLNFRINILTNGLALEKKIPFLGLKTVLFIREAVFLGGLWVNLHNGWGGPASWSKYSDAFFFCQREDYLCGLSALSLSLLPRTSMFTHWVWNINLYVRPIKDEASPLGGCSLENERG